MSLGWSEGAWGDGSWGGVVVVSGVSSSGQVGNASFRIPETVEVTTEIFARGWGRSTWGSEAWNEQASLGQMEGVGAVGSTFVNADANVSGLSGVSVIKFLGDEEVITNNNISVTGFGLGVSLGAFSIKLVNRVSVTGTIANSNISAVSITGDAKVNVTGLVSVTSLGNNLVWGKINTDQTPNWQTIKEAA
tara:strand:+ start:506 stop:1078 length:573 start_codon:yes stop_codon:yes gene_type:complete